MNIQNNAQNNIGKQNSVDYYKELKDILKEIDKIYKKLSKDESLADMIDSIKNEFINKNIDLIEKSLSKPNYKDFNSKIIKILEVIIKLLRNFTFYNVNKDNDANETVEKTLIIINKEGEPVKSQEDLDNAIKEAFKDELERITKETDEKKKEASTEILEIKKLICTFEYYKYIFENPDQEKEAQIKSLKEDIENFKKSPQPAPPAPPNPPPNDKIAALNNLIEDDKKKHRQLFSYIPLISYNVFDFVDKRFAKEDNPDGDTKKKSKDSEPLIEQFKKDIYFIVIGINNTRSTDIDSQISENSNEIVDLKARKEVLKDQKELLDKQLKNLNDVIKFLIDSNKQEYSAEIKEIQGIFKDYKNEKEYKDTILTLIVNEEAEAAKIITKNELLDKQLREKQKQQIALLEKENNMRLQNPRNGYQGHNGGRGRGSGRGSGRRIGSIRKARVIGGEKKSNKYYEDKYQKLKDLKISISKLKEKIRVTEGKEDSGDPFEKKNAMFGDPSEGFNSIYNNIWNDYIKETKKVKAKGVTMESLKQDNRLYDRVKMNGLDPQDILKINFQDKVIFICIILIIRTFAMVLIEFLIEYNIVSTLTRGILIYSVIYILLVICSVLLINYDSYKLRIIVNYLNLHINSSNIFFHIVLFILFIGLILIIVNDNDNGLQSIDNVFNYTYIYKYIYEIAEKSKTTSDLLLTQKEKVKLQYRMDIITMIIFIFSSLLILIM
jgi:hypothetical protein